MKLLALSIEGLRKIKAASFDFDGKNLVQIRGKNGSGKSTVIDAIRFLMKGTKEVPSDVVTHGFEKAEIVGTIDDYVIRRLIKPDGKTSLTIESKSGKVPKPQEFLDKISNQFLDPQWFMSLPGPEKKKVLMDYLGIDFTEIDSRIKQAEEERLIVGRELRAIGEVVPVPKSDPVSMSNLLERRKEILAFNQEQKGKQKRIEDKIKELISFVERSLRLLDAEKEIKKIEHRWETIDKETRQMIQEIKKLPIPEAEKSLEEVDNEIARIEELNKKAQAYQQYLQKKKYKEDKQALYDALDEQVKKLRQEKIDMVNNAKLPIPGLTFTENGLSFQGVTDENWSESESLKIAIMLAHAFSGELNLVYIKNGNAFDSESMRKIKSYAEKHDMQIIMEVVDDSYALNDESVIYIEEGEIKVPHNVLNTDR